MPSPLQSTAIHLRTLALSDSTCLGPVGNRQTDFSHVLREKSSKAWVGMGLYYLISGTEARKGG